MTQDAGEGLSQAFIEQAARHLEEDFLPKIRSCLDLITEDEVWWRGSEGENSIGNLLLHLDGNVRQWIVAGLGGERDERKRDAEFAARGGVTGQEAYSSLASTVGDAVRVLRDLKPEDLRRQGTIQGFPCTGLQAVFHVVEHFSYHTGQIAYITKLRKQTDLKFYNL